MFGWVYILHLGSGRYYIGSTTNLEKRIVDHQSGRSKYTSKFLPITLAFKYRCPTYKSARKLETKLKSLKSRKIIENIIKNNKLTVLAG